MTMRCLCGAPAMQHCEQRQCCWWRCSRHGCTGIYDPLTMRWVLGGQEAA